MLTRPLSLGIGLMVLLLDVSIAFTQPVLLNEVGDHYNLSPHMDVLKAPSEEWTIQDIYHSSQELWLAKNRNGNPSFGVADGIYWARFRIDHQKGEADFFLKMESPIYGGSLTFYYPDDEGFAEQSYDAFAPLSARTSSSFYPVFALPRAEGLQTYYLRLDSKGTVAFRASLYQREALARYSTDYRSKYSLLSLLLSLILVFVVIAYFFIRIPLFLYYGFYLATMIFTILVTGGIAATVFWPGYMLLDYWMQLLALPLIFLSMSLYCRQFLKGKMIYGWLDRLFAYLIKACFIFLLLAPFLEMNHPIYAMMTYCCGYGLLLLFSVAVWCSQLKDRSLLCLVLAVLVIMATFSYYDMLEWGLLPYVVFWGDYLVLIGVFLEMFFLALSLLFTFQRLMKDQEGSLLRLGRLQLLEQEVQKVKVENSLLQQQRNVPALALPSSYYLNPLTERELQILGLLAEGYSNRDIAERQFVSINTVKSHLKNIYQKLEAGSRIQAVNCARQYGLIN